MRISVRITRPANGAAIARAEVRVYNDQRIGSAVGAALDDKGRVITPPAGFDVGATSAITIVPQVVGTWQWRADVWTAEGCTDTTALDGRRTFEVVK